MLMDSQAQRVLDMMESVPLRVLDAKRELVLDAAHIKAQCPMSYRMLLWWLLHGEKMPSS